MSYAPRIIVLKKDLDKNKNYILHGDWQHRYTKEGKEDEKTRGGEEGKTVMEYIKYAYENYAIVIVGGIQLILLSPSIGSFNKRVREKLDELEVEYGLDN